MAILTVFAGLLCALTVASAQQQPTYASIYEFAHSRGDLSIYSLGMDMFPDIAIRFADPSLNFTTFIPTDQAIRDGMMFFYGLARPLTTYEALKVMYRNDNLLYPAAVPDPMSGLSGRSQNSILWTVINNHGLQLPGAHVLQDLVPNQWYPNTLPVAIQGLPPQQLRVHSDYKTVESYLVPSSNIVESNIRAGNSIVHLVDSVLWPNLTLTPFSSIDDIFLNPLTSDVTMFPQIMARAAKAVTGPMDIVNSKVPLTIFVPTDVAINAFLGRVGMSFNQMLSSKRRCADFIKAHTLNAVPAAGYALYLLDLIRLGMNWDLSKDVLPAQFPLFLPGLDGLPRRNYIYNFLGQEFQTVTNITQFVKGPTMVGFGGPMGQILTLVNFGGTVAIHAGVASCLHKVNAVLVDSLQ